MVAFTKSLWSSNANLQKKLKKKIEKDKIIKGTVNVSSKADHQGYVVLI